MEFVGTVGPISRKICFRQRLSTVVPNFPLFPQFYLCLTVAGAAKVGASPSPAPLTPH